MGLFKKKTVTKTYDKENKKPVIKASICNGEQVVGFKDIHTGKIEEIMLIKNQADLDALKATIAGIGEEVTDAQIEELKAGKEKLMNSAQKLFAKMYEQTQGAGAQGAGPDMGAQGAGNANDDVVDGEFTEV